VPQNSRLLALSISIVLLSPVAHALSDWNCSADADGGWVCSGSTEPAAAEPIAPPPRPGMHEPPSKTPAENPTTSVVVSADEIPIAKSTAPASIPKVLPEQTDRPSAGVTATPLPSQLEQEPAVVETTAAAPGSEEKPAGDPPDTDIDLLTDADLDRGLNWNQCYPWSNPAPLSFEPPQGEETLIEAGGMVLRQKEDTVLLDDRAEVRAGSRMMEADEILYDRGAATLDASGNVYFEQQGLRFSSQSAHFDLDRKQGELRQVEYRVVDQGARGKAESAEIESADLTHFKGISYSTCRPGNNDWLLQAEELDIDRAEGTGVARHAKLRFKGIPFAYLPYASFPIDDRRKSGFLLPSIGTGDRSGFDIATPYYFNIAPELDATLTPRYLSKRGFMLGGEMRYLQAKHRGEIRAEILPDDQEVAAGENNTRGAFSYQASGNPAPRWGFDANLNYVSDNQYLDDLGNSLAVTSTRQLERRGDVTYTGDGWDVLGRVQYFQTVDEDISSSNRPYTRLPQLLLNLDKPRQAMGLRYLLRTEYVNFDHSDDNKVKGHRFDIQPGVSLPLTRPWGFFTPQASVRYTGYNLENQTPGESSNPDRTLPTLSLDGGLYFDRYTTLFDTALTQTLEPRLFYLLTPYENQDDLPDFDTSAVDFSFASLFRENRFSGSDRVGDANQLTAALTSRTLSDSTGAELFRASIGQIYYFRDREVRLLSGATPLDDSSSPLVAELAARMSDDWSTRASIQWNPHKDSSQTEKGAFSLLYRDSDQRVANLSYRFTDTLVEQTDISGRWPITPRLGVVGRWTYSLLHETTMLGFAGFEYDSCCWRVRLLAQQLLTSVDDEPLNTVMLQFELKGLASIGHEVDDYLEDSILGYHAN